MDEDESIALERRCKLLSSDVAVWVTQEGQQLHGGWAMRGVRDLALRGRCDGAADLRGVKPILELKVIARNLLG